MAFSIKKALASIDSRAPDLTEERDKMRAALAPRLDPNSIENRLARARQNELAVLQQIELLREEKNGDLRRARIDIALTRLGEIYAEQGRYQEAIEVTKDADRRKQYRDIQKAIIQPNDKTCDCPVERVVNGKREESLSPRINSETVVSGPYGRLMTVEKCVRCGYENAR